jgi:hypothetical protein
MVSRFAGMKAANHWVAYSAPMPLTPRPQNVRTPASLIPLSPQGVREEEFLVLVPGSWAGSSALRLGPPVSRK